MAITLLTNGEAGFQSQSARMLPNLVSIQQTILVTLNSSLVKKSVAHNTINLFMNALIFNYALSLPSNNKAEKVNIDHRIAIHVICAPFI